MRGKLPAMSDEPTDFDRWKAYLSAYASFADRFVLSDEVPCPKCGGPRIPPYVGEDGYYYEGRYCPSCGVSL